MGKIHKTLRVEEDTAARISTLQQEGESEAAAYSRVITAGLEALEGSEEAAKDGDAGVLVQSLTEHIDTLKAVNEELSKQLHVKDAQIEMLTNITQAAQLLDGYGRKQLEEPEEEKRGLWARLFG